MIAFKIKSECRPIVDRADRPRIDDLEPAPVTLPDGARPGAGLRPYSGARPGTPARPVGLDLAPRSEAHRALRSQAMTHPDAPAVERATFDVRPDTPPTLTIAGQTWTIPDELLPDLPQLPANPSTEDRDAYARAILAVPYLLAARTYEITGRWHIVPAPKVEPGQVRLPARNAATPEAGVLVVDVEEVHEPETEQTVPYLAQVTPEGQLDLYVHPGETEPRPLQG